MKKVPKLRLKLWEEIIYTLLVVGAPAAITCIELFQSHSTVLKISMTSVGALLITLIVAKKFFVNNKILKWKERITMLEHDYSIEVGNPENCKSQWAMYNLFIFVYNAVCVIIALVLVILFVNALVDGLLAFKGAAILILFFALVAILFKTCCYFAFAKSVKEIDNEK